MTGDGEKKRGQTPRETGRHTPREREGTDPEKGQTHRGKGEKPRERETLRQMEIQTGVKSPWADLTASPLPWSYFQKEN